MRRTSTPVHAAETPAGTVEVVKSDRAFYRIWNNLYTVPAPGPRFVTVGTNNFQTGRPREIGFDGTRFYEAQAAWKSRTFGKMEMSLMYVSEWHEMHEITPDEVRNADTWHVMDDSFSQWRCRKLFNEQFPR